MSSHQHNRTHTARLFVLLAGLMLGGCASSPPTDQPDPTNPTPRTTSGLIASIDTRSGQIDAVVGRAAVVPVTLTGPLPANGKLAARLDDGRLVAASLLWLVIEPPAANTRWVPTPTWRTLPATSSSVPDTPGRWVLLLELPIDAVGQSIWLDSKRRPIHWLPSPETLMSGLREADGQTPEPWTSPLSPEALRSASLRSELGQMRRDPFSAWRAELALGELWDQHTLPTQRRAPGVNRPSDLAVEVLTEHQRARWLSVLATAWRLDPALATRLRDALIPCVRLGQGVWLPAWGRSGEADALDRLADAVLNEELNDDVKAERIEQWLGDQPQALAWVIDDAGGSPLVLEDQRSGPTLGVANLRSVDSLAWIDPPADSTDGPAVSKAAPLATTQLQLPAWNLSSTHLLVHCGSWTGTTRLGSTSVLVRPPGLRIGPFAVGWNAPAWLAADPTFAAAEPEGFLTRGQLYPKTDSQGHQHWTVLLECQAPPNTTGDELVLWVGPMGASISVVSASPLSGVRTLEGQAPRAAEVVRDTSSDRVSWRMEIELPPEAVSPEGRLLLGAVRLHDGSVFSSWPRRMMPGQLEPGRLPIDLSRWQAVTPSAPKAE